MHLLDSFPEDTLIKLEFNKIKEQTRSNCISSLGEEKLEKLYPTIEYESIITRLYEVKEFTNIIEFQKNFPIENYINLNEILSLVRITDYIIYEEEFYKILLVLLTIERIVTFFKDNNTIYPNLYHIIEAIVFPKQLKKEIERTIDDKGQIKPNCTDNLLRIIKKIEKKEAEIDGRFNNILNYCKQNAWLSNETESIRQGERVLAIESKFKKKVKGIVLDISSTGRTCFIQPEEILQIRNELFEFVQEQRKEITLIFKKLTEQTRPFVNDLLSFNDIMGEFDLIRAKSRLAIEQRAIMPRVINEPFIHIINGYHPILVKHLQNSGKKAVPINIKLDARDRILVISGPNAGGKTVCLKTVGLLQLMLQSGYLLPVDENSLMGIFKKLYIEIGDDQSIENELSTYSSKLSNMKYFIQNSNEDTLFLVDESGSGTDPEYGGVIAEELLLQLNNKKSFGVLTTHYPNLKLLALNTEGFINGAMVFDRIKLHPTYQLNMGEPGSSYAIEILQNIGFKQDIIDDINNRLNTNTKKIDDILANLQKENEALNKDKNNVAQKLNQLDKDIERYNKLREETERIKLQLLKESKNREEELLRGLEKEFEKQVSEWKSVEEKLKPEETKIVRKILIEKRKTVEKDIVELNSKLKLKAKVEPVSVGSTVRIKGSSSVGVIAKIKKDKAIVTFDNHRTEIDLSLLELMHIEKAKNTSYQGKSLSSYRDINFKPEIDIRGQRMEEAIQNVEIFIDKSILSNFHVLRIIHGHGDGILKRTVRDLLKKYKFIESFKSEQQEFGGDGVTVVTLK